VTFAVILVGVVIGLAYFAAIGLLHR